MTKQELRRLYKTKRSGLSFRDINKYDDLLLINFQKVEIPFLYTLLSYFPMPANNEPATHLFSNYLRFINPELRVCYPVTDFSSSKMEAVITGDQTEFITTTQGIEEPVSGDIIPAIEIDMVFVPLLAVDKSGYRVGYGKGFYDRYLKKCSSDCISVGFSYFEPVEAISDKDEFDVPLDLCITPQEVYVF